ncbi:MAG: cold shock domain-containing protein [Anaerolineae bacterium]|nr:cold shock domain-containing protein [Anaerolineae bacterium]
MVTIERYRGIVSYIDTFGRGRIQMPDGREVAVRYSSVRGNGIRCLAKGAMVTFQLQETRRGLCAVCVQPEN